MTISADRVDVPNQPEDMNLCVVELVEQLRVALELLDFHSYDYYDWWSTP